MHTYSGYLFRDNGKQESLDGSVQLVVILLLVYYFYVVDNVVAQRHTQSL